MLQLTDQAIHKVKQLLAAEDKQGYGLRVAVQGGGCSGFQYGLTWENKAQDDDKTFEFHGLKVFVDPMSVLYLDGVRIDYLDSLEGAGFKIENPNATGTCGCGHSFQV